MIRPGAFDAKAQRTTIPGTVVARQVFGLGGTANEWPPVSTASHPFLLDSA